MPTSPRCSPARIRRSSGSRWRNCSRTTSACAASASRCSGTRAPRARRGAARSRERLRESLPFALTGAQQRVFAEVRDDLARPRADAAPGAGRRRQRQDRGRGAGGAAGGRSGQPGGADGADRTARRTAPGEPARAGWNRSACAWRWLAGKVTGKARAQALAEVASGEAQVRGRHACADAGRRGVPRPRAGDRRRAAPLRRAPAPGAARQGRAAATACRTSW